MSSGYTDCPCCGVVIISSPGDLCDCCNAAGCEAHDCEQQHRGRAECDMHDVYDDCQIPRCPECDVEASFCTDRGWHTNCDTACENAGKDWAP